MLSSITKKGETVSASSPLVGFGELNDNTIKGLTSLLSGEQKIESIAYTWFMFKPVDCVCYSWRLLLASMSIARGAYQLMW